MYFLNCLVSLTVISNVCYAYVTLIQIFQHLLVIYLYFVIYNYLMLHFICVIMLNKYTYIYSIQKLIGNRIRAPTLKGIRISDWKGSRTNFEINREHGNRIRAPAVLGIRIQLLCWKRSRSDSESDRELDPSPYQERDPDPALRLKGFQIRLWTGTGSKPLPG